jgi:hypothetical protein
MAVVLTGTGIAALAMTSSAQAATQSFTVFQQQNNTALGAPTALGSRNISLNVTPTSAAVNSPIEVTVGGNIPFGSGPAVGMPGVDSYRIDAVVTINGADRLLTGPRNPVGTAATNTTTLNSGWVISSTAGNSTGTGPVAVPASSTGEGSFALNAAGVASSNAATLAAPSAPGTYAITLKTLVWNNVSTVNPADDGVGYAGTWANSGSGTNDIGDAESFDVMANTNAAPAPWSAVQAGSGSFGFTAPGVTLSVFGPNATVAQVTGQNAGVAAIRPPQPPFTGYVDNPTTIQLTGNTWGANVTSGGFTAQFCDTTGTVCDAPAPATGTITTSLTTNASGVINGGVVSVTRIGSGAWLTPGNRAVKLTQGANSALVPILVLGTPTLTITPTGGGAGTAVSVSSGNYFNPGQPVVLRGGTDVTVNAFSLTWGVSTDAPSSAVNANPDGTISGLSFNVNDPATTQILALQNNTSGTYAANGASVARAATSFSFSAGACIAYVGNKSAGGGVPGANGLNGSPDPNGCSIDQNVEVSVTPGNLTMRNYRNTTAAVVFNDSAKTVAGTINSTVTPTVNTNNTQINLGTITTPLAPRYIVGNINDIVVSDSRGGTFGWSLTADLDGALTAPGATISAANLTASPSCTQATTANAFDYDAPKDDLGTTGVDESKVVISGFDPSFNAPAPTNGAANQAFGNDTVTAGTLTTVQLCNKPANTTNAITDSTGGVFYVVAPVTLTVPSFQAAGTYTAVMTVTLV